MKISLLSNIKAKTQKEKSKGVSFKAGFTPQIQQEIARADILEISKKLSEKGIKNNFRGEKIVAWCCDKAVDIFEQLNQKFKLDFTLPKAILVEDFEKLNLKNSNVRALCLEATDRPYPNSEEVAEPTTIFINNLNSAKKRIPPERLASWDKIDFVADYGYANSKSSSDFFLTTFLHEFSHSAHIGNLLKKMDGEAVFNRLISIEKPEYLDDFHLKYGPKISQICAYAATDPMEAIACDLSTTIVNSLDREAIVPVKNTIIGSPYDPAIISGELNPDASLKDILRCFWGGRFSS